MPVPLSQRAWKDQRSSPYSQDMIPSYSAGTSSSCCKPVPPLPHLFAGFYLQQSISCFILQFLKHRFTDQVSITANRIRGGFEPLLFSTANIILKTWLELELTVIIDMH